MWPYDIEALVMQQPLTRKSKQAWRIVFRESTKAMRLATLTVRHGEASRRRSIHSDTFSEKRSQDTDGAEASHHSVQSSDQLKRYDMIAFISYSNFHYFRCLIHYSTEGTTSPHARCLVPAYPPPLPTCCRLHHPQSPCHRG